jgi:hypothetical protein
VAPPTGEFAPVLQEKPVHLVKSRNNIVRMLGELRRGSRGFLQKTAPAPPLTCSMTSVLT